MNSARTIDFSALQQQLEGELYTDRLQQIIYATDASVYRELPLAVAIPKSVADLKQLIRFANDNKTSLIPRAGGTSLAGQCVGNGIVVDISKYFNQILEFNAEEQWVRVQPGVVRDELNAFLKPHGFFFSPITSTANRAMIGGMVGNNSSGTTSIEYGSTRDHVLEIKALLSDASESTFYALDKNKFEEKTRNRNLEGNLYRHIYKELKDDTQRQRICDNFPKASIHRRNTGYAVDYLMNTAPFKATELHFDFCKLLCGSEGTLALTTEIKLHVDPLPAPHNLVVAAHFDSVHHSMLATQIAMQQRPSACELMDKIILDCTKDNIEQSKNRFFVEGDPEAVLMVEFRGQTKAEAQEKADTFITNLKTQNLGYAFPIIYGERTKAVWQLRSAGLGLLANIPGDKKAVACIEDTAVDIDDLPQYIDDFSEMMDSFGQRAVYYAHAGAGELHLRPILDLKKSEDREQFYHISKASAELVKSYNGSLSGEHGDGRVRAAFIPLMVGDEVYDLFRRIKSTWDPNNIFNPGKIVDAQPMNESLRYEPEQRDRQFETAFDFSQQGGILRAAEQCNGSGDCRKLSISGGTMCPSYRATRDEKDTTRARANALREMMTRSEKVNPFDQKELKEVMDLCISCKGCTSECPSNVDVSSLKAEFLYQYQKANGIPLRSRAFANIHRLNTLGGLVPGVYNFFLQQKMLSGLAKKVLGVAPERSLPSIASRRLRSWFKKDFQSTIEPNKAVKTIYLFVDEFTDWNDTEIGKKAVLLLDRLGYDIKVLDHAESGRAAISKGLLDYAKKVANQNVVLFADAISAETPLIGIEPSAILSFRDEYPRLVDKHLQSKAHSIADHTFTIEEFLAKEMNVGNINTSFFHQHKRKLLLHGHCHQKALTKLEDAIQVLSLPKNYHVEVILSGCCGMAGSFGYEAEHYEVSQQIGELVLFPAVRAASADTILVASGTSCRHQILDGTQREAKHFVEVLYEALVER
ncbi:MAG: FAD-linked oxidase C-terminal domain-containing protein [Bacteroidota bacterium]